MFIHILNTIHESKTNRYGFEKVFIWKVKIKERLNPPYYESKFHINVQNRKTVLLTDIRYCVSSARVSINISNIFFIIQQRQYLNKSNEYFMDLLKIYFMNIKFPLNPINRSRDGNKIFGISTILIGQSKKYLSRILGLYFKQIMINNILDLLTLQEGGLLKLPLHKIGNLSTFQ